MSTRTAPAVGNDDVQAMLDALGVQEIQRTYLVDTGRRRPLTVNLRFEETPENFMGVDPFGDDARVEAVDRARRILRRKGVDTSGIDLTPGRATFVRERLVPAIAR